jgi:hypothetical protein
MERLPGGLKRQGSFQASCQLLTFCQETFKLLKKMDLIDAGQIGPGKLPLPNRLNISHKNSAA